MENSLPLVSVIVPSYNHDKYLEQRLKSIFNQTYLNFEVILLDDCSTDSSGKILAKYAKNPKVSHCVFNEINSGNTFIQWNKGIELAKGDYIWIAESDDFCELNFLEELIQSVLQDSEIMLVYCQSNRADETGKITGNWLNHTDNLDAELFLTSFVMDGNEFIERFLIYKNVIPNISGVLFSKECAVQLGTLDMDPGMRTCGDWLFYFKLINNNKISYINKSLNNFRYHSQSVIANAVKKLNWATIIEIDFLMRKKMFDFLSINKPHNYVPVFKINKSIIKKLEYERGMFYYKKGRKIKGGLILFSVIDIFIKKYNFKKNFKLKCNRFFKLRIK
ncbi:glycosyltransferase family 2 protein [Flavobacterium sp. ZB4P23]|uniref:glycosyltransferase family 2 protein n=1 Tax=Flavobacterium sp. ZB4P23 TaxID=2497484 RepID=UPI000F830176|nr:glycosyltransferase family A protein [Flavobacterium sp. ZB4P23]RTY83272.1 glycosyltransferase family 2 protein [Flavobacterium sp. ZB4P23]